MRVPEDHRRDPYRNRVEIERHPVMQHIDRLSAQLHQLRLREPSAASTPVHVASNRRHRRGIPKSVKDIRLAHISCMQDMLDPAQRRDRLRSEQTMRI